MARAYAAEDGNLNVKSVTVAVEKTYKDIDLTFQRRPGGDIFKKTDAASVKQAVKNILLTRVYEKPFFPGFGTRLNQLLFSLDTEFDDDEDIKDEISTAIAKFEPRARVVDIKTVINGERHEARATITFEIVNTAQTFSIELNLARLR